MRKLMKPCFAPVTTLVLFSALFAALVPPIQGGSVAQTNWVGVLASMPLPVSAPPLNRDNALCLLVDAFRSNNIVKAIVILPGAADDFYLVHRDEQKLNLRAGNLHEAIRALTNTTALRATFRPPLLLLHTVEDQLEPRLTAVSSATLTQLKAARHLPSARFCDTHWDAVQPVLQRALGRTVRPDVGASAAWHFERPSVAGWGLTDWEWLAALSLATRAGVQAGPNTIEFRSEAR